MYSVRFTHPWIALSLLATAICAEPALADTSQSPASITCLSAPVQITRYGHGQQPSSLRLTQCDGSPNPAAVRSLSILARPRRVPAPGPAANDSQASSREGWISADIRRVSPQLLVRLQTLANQWPGETITIVSGHRPRARSTSRHHHAEALDIQISNVPQREVASFARNLAGTGVGYYPNSLFTHIDIRPRSAFWVDLSRPGERSRYVAANERDAYLEAPEPEQSVARVTPTQPAAERAPSAPAPSAAAPVALTRSQAMANALSHVESLRVALEARRTRAARTEEVATVALDADSEDPGSQERATVAEPTPAAPVEAERVARMLANAAALAEGGEH